jgi:hypothetical protein
MPHSARYFSNWLPAKPLVGLSILTLCFLKTSGISIGQEPGQTPQPKVELPQASEEERVRLDRTLRWFDAVTEGPFRLRGQEEKLPPELEGKGLIEMKAYNYVLAHAAKQPMDLLRKYSVKDVQYQSLLADVRRDYFRDLIHFKGVLRRLQPLKPTEELASIDGIKRLYEAWIIPDGAKDFLCLVVSELPEDIKEGDDLYVRVAFDAYYFKHYHYQSSKKKSDGKPQWMAAPLFLGRSFENLGPPPSEGPIFSGTMLIGVLSGLSIIILIAVSLGVWFRRGDRKVRALTERRLHESVSFENIPESETPAARLSD